MAEENNVYDGNSVPQLDYMEHVRKRPGMYFGGVDARALHNLIYEIVENTITQAKFENATELAVKLYDGNRVSIVDNGAGIPVDFYQDTGKRIFEHVIGNRGGKHLNADMRFHGGMMGIGVGSVNAVSSELEAIIKRDGFVWRQLYKKGKKETEVEQVRPMEDGENTGTAITFTPDYTILDDNPFDYTTLRNRLREIAYFVPNLKVELDDKRVGQEQSNVFHYPQGIVSYLQYLNRDYTALHEPIIMSKTVSHGKVAWSRLEDIEVEIALQYVDFSHSAILGFAYPMYVVNGGVYEHALLETLSNVVWRYAKGSILQSTDVVQGLTAVINIHHPNLQLSHQSTQRLLNPDLYDIIENMIIGHFEQESPEVLGVIAGWYLAHKRVRDVRRFGSSEQ